MVHLIRASLRYASRKYWAPLTRDLRSVYTAPDEAAAAAALEAFAASWETRYPAIVKLWRAHWTGFIPFLAFPPEVRRVIYTTDENVNPAAGWGCGSVAAARRSCLMSRPAAAVKVERPAGRTTLTAVRTAVASGSWRAQLTAERRAGHWDWKSCRAA